MSEMAARDEERRRELALHRYIEAFDRGDLGAMEAVVNEALDDPELAGRITEVNAALHREAGLGPIERDAELVRLLILRYLPSAVERPTDERATVGQVAARIEGQFGPSRALHPTDRMANRQLLGSEVPLPEQATTASIASLAQQLDVHASERYWEIFRREAVLVSMAHASAAVESLAARSQSRRRRSRETRRHD